MVTVMPMVSPSTYVPSGEAKRIDWTMRDGLAEIPIEERDAGEVLTVGGRDSAGRDTRVALAPAGSRAANPAFDVTPARLVTALVTDRGVCETSEEGLRGLFPERAAPARSAN